eukprot:12419746-Karenia_brevis.AAC.1
MLPNIQRVRRLGCAHRGELLHGIGVEGCTQRWGSDDEALDSHARLTALYRGPNDADGIDIGSTVRAS